MEFLEELEKFEQNLSSYSGLNSIAFNNSSILIKIRKLFDDFLEKIKEYKNKIQLTDVDLYRDLTNLENLILTFESCNNIEKNNKISEIILHLRRLIILIR